MYIGFDLLKCFMCVKEIYAHLFLKLTQLPNIVNFNFSMSNSKYVNYLKLNKNNYSSDTHIVM